MKWIRENWQIISAAVLVSVWKLGAIIQHKTMSTSLAHGLDSAAEHRQRLEKADEKITQRIEKVEQVSIDTGKQLTAIQTTQPANGKQLDKIDGKLTRILEARP